MTVYLHAKFSSSSFGFHDQLFGASQGSGQSVVYKTVTLKLSEFYFAFHILVSCQSTYEIFKLTAH